MSHINRISSMLGHNTRTYSEATNVQPITSHQPAFTIIGAHGTPGAYENMCPTNRYLLDLVVLWHKMVLCCLIYQRV